MLSVLEFGQVIMILYPYQVSVLNLQDIGTVYMVSDWLITNLGTANMYNGKEWNCYSKCINC